MDVHEDDGKDDPVDASGYTGQFHRKRRDLVPISDVEFILLMLRKNRLADMMRKIKEIDKERNGFVTQTELDDILKILFADELGGRDLTKLIKPFCSIQNKILVDYKKFRDFIVSQLKQLDQNYKYTGSNPNSPEKERPDYAKAKSKSQKRVFDNDVVEVPRSLLNGKTELSSLDGHI